MANAVIRCWWVVDVVDIDGTSFKLEGDGRDELRQYLNLFKGVSRE